jgi:hypothetical protein
VAREWNLRLPPVAGLAIGLSLMAGSARAYYYTPPVPFRAKDFTLVKRDGMFHLFYTQADTTRNAPRVQVRFGHAVSRDLWFWQEVGPVLDVQEGIWEHDHVWAPHVIEADGLYYMFYTGVNEVQGPVATTLVQSIGVAISSDLYNWTRLPQPVLTCESIPWSYCSPGQSLGADLRDPFVMEDPGSPGDYLMFHATRLGFETEAMVAGLATSGDLLGWQDQGPLMVTHHSTSFSVLTESPHVFEHAGTYYLMWTTNSGQPLVFATSSSPSGGWTYRGRLGWMLGKDTSSWFASEVLRDGERSHFAFVHFDRIALRDIEWSPTDDAFSLDLPDTFHVFNMFWSVPVAAHGQQVTLFFEAVGSAGRSVGLEWWEVDEDGAWDPIDPVAWGLPSSLTLGVGGGTLSWTVPSWSDPDDPDPDAEYVVRLADGTHQSPVLATQQPAPDAGGSRRRDQANTEGDLVNFRLLRTTPLGPGPVLAFELARRAPVRLELFDLAGRRVATLLDGEHAAGAHLVRLDAEPRPPGLYFARLATPREARTLRVPLAR